MTFSTVVNALQGKRFIVTGATHGIGNAIAGELLSRGACVGANYRTSLGQIDELSSRFSDLVVPLRFDVRDGNEVDSAFRDFVGTDSSLDGLINNAGIGGQPSMLVNATVERIREMVDTNLLGPIICARAALPHMLRKGRGVILNVGSVSSIRPMPGITAYAATKGGLESFTYALAVEYARKGIRSHCLRCGPVNTRLISELPEAARSAVASATLVGRVAEPSEIAQFAVQLLSGETAFSTGAVHTLDGGAFLR